MKTIESPEFDVETLYSVCTSSISDEALKQFHRECLNDIISAESEFTRRFPLNEIYLIEQIQRLSAHIGAIELKKLYTYRMINPELEGRKYYNLILSQAPNGKCPLCTIRKADTLDHYLPKAKFPVYSVTPLNLIPSCKTCNTEKKIEAPISPETQTLHPYFDRVENERFIKATVLETNPICFNYFVECPNHWPDILKDRVKNHFKSFGLSELFSSHANEELTGRRYHHRKLAAISTQILFEQLSDSCSSYLVLGLNSWQYVMYKALAESDWYLNTGSRQDY